MDKKKMHEHLLGARTTIFHIFNRCCRQRSQCWHKASCFLLKNVHELRHCSFHSFDTHHEGSFIILYVPEGLFASSHCQMCRNNQAACLFFFFAFTYMAFKPSSFCSFKPKVFSFSHSSCHFFFLRHTDLSKLGRHAHK